MKISSEERAMLEAEGVYLPEDMPLTKVGPCLKHVLGNWSSV